MVRSVHKTFDADLQLKDAGLVAASAAAQVAGSDQILDLGDATQESGASWVDGTVVIDVTAIEVDSGDEVFNIGWQLSSTSDFSATIHEGATLIVGDAAALPGDADSPTGRYHLRVSNYHGGTIYRYARLYTTVAGTVATGINYSAYLAVD